MEDDELIERLLAQTGALLEDASAIALLQGEHSVPVRVRRIQHAIVDAKCLMDAAAVLVRRRGRPI